MFSVRVMTARFVRLLRCDIHELSLIFLKIGIFLSQGTAVHEAQITNLHVQHAEIIRCCKRFRAPCSGRRVIKSQNKCWRLDLFL